MSVTLTGAAPLPAYNGTVSATVLATPGAGTTVTSITYSLDSAATTPYNAQTPITVTTAGSHSSLSR